jgi:hypothetical protein
MLRVELIFGGILRLALAGAGVGVFVECKIDIRQFAWVARIREILPLKGHLFRAEIQN